MIDIHNHILPGIDDGAKNMEETLEMVRELYETGFYTLIATPHVMEGRGFISSTEILALTEQVQQQVAEAGIPIQILPGAENYVFPDMANWFNEGKLLTLGNTGKYLLVELPMLEIPRYTDQVFFDLQVKGITPVLAHPERYQALVDEPERLLDWARKGILFQLDLRSITGKYGTSVRKFARTILNSDLVHFVGSDAHCVTTSKLVYKDSLQKVKEFVGDKRFLELTTTNPGNILKGKVKLGERDYSLKELTSKKKGFWKLFISKF
jgi:protein-tyrosine phosphatase